MSGGTLLSILAFNAVASILLGGLVFACLRWSVRRESQPTDEWKIDVCHAGFISTITFVVLSLRFIPPLLHGDLGDIIEAVAKVGLACVAGYVVHGLLLRLLFRT